MVSRRREHLTCALLLALCISATASAQQTDQPLTPPAGTAQVVRANVAIKIPKLDRPPVLGDFNGMQPATPLAQQMAKVTNFIQLDPKEGAPAQQRTDAYLGYDSKNFYVVWVCFDKDPKKIRAILARRDTIGPEHDEVQLYLDTFNDRRRAYGFMINPLGVQYDYIWTDYNGYDSSYDTVWNSDGKLTEQGYIGLMSIPFKSLRFYRQPDQTWGIILQRVIPHDNDNSFYPALTRKIQGRLTQEGQVSGLSGILPGRNIQLTPYVVGRNTKYIDVRDPNHPFFTSNSAGGDAGLDAKVILHDSLVLDLTFNPDFRQVESDEPQTTVNQRFEVFFPEKRPFFQENANFFTTPINLYFTRRIVDPQFGLRLTGKLADNWDIGLLSIDDQFPGRVVPDWDPIRRKRAFFNIGRLAYDIGKQSHIGVFYADREFSADPGTTCTLPACVTDNNRVGAVDGHFQMGEHFNTEFQVAESSTDFADGTHQAGPSSQAYAEYSTRAVEYNVLYQDTSAGFLTETGFFRRPDIRRESHFFSYKDYHETWLTWWGPQLFHVAAWDHTGNLLEYDWEPGFAFTFKANTDFGIVHGFQTEKLRPQDFGPPVTSDLYFNKGYWYGWLDTTYFKWFAIHANMQLGKAINFEPPALQLPFLSNETNVNLQVTLRPFGNLTVDNTYILERLRDRATGLSILNFNVIRSKFNYQFTKELSVRTIFQYSSTIANPLLSSLENGKQFNADFLITYLLHPGTAVYVGYNSDLQNLDRLAIYNHTGLFRTRNSFLEDGRQFFVKLSYQFRY